MKKKFKPPKRVIEPQPNDKIMTFMEFQLYNKHGRENNFTEKRKK